MAFCDITDPNAGWVGVGIDNDTAQFSPSMLIRRWLAQRWGESGIPTLTQPG